MSGINGTNNSTVSGNMASGNGAGGIRVLGACSGNTLSGNIAMGNGDVLGGFDLEDDSTAGTGTAGTKNTWLNNKALTRSPAGLL